MAPATAGGYRDALRSLGREGLYQRPFRLALDPVELPGLEPDVVRLLGPAMLQFYRSLDRLYARSLEPVGEWGFVREYLDQGKPESLLRFARSRRFRNDVPRVLRPDLLMTPEGPVLTEMDAVPGGMGLLLELSLIMQSQGKPNVWGTSQGILFGFAAMIRSIDPSPSLAIVVSDESKDYFSEMDLLARRLDEGFFPAVCLHPHQLRFDEEGLFYRKGDGREVRISIIYRFFELFDLPNIPKMDILLYFVKGGKVKITPPIKPWHEEKLGLALWHHPRLRGFWKETVSPEAVDLFDRLIPPTWVLDPRPIPPVAQIPGLRVGERSVWDFHELGKLTQKERHLIIKPSGFSPLAWGSRGIVIGHDVSEDEWAREIEVAFSAFWTSPYVLQPYMTTSPVLCRVWDHDTGLASFEEMRVRACPYYFVTDPDVHFGGILVTACPMDKKIIHGMMDSILSPAAHPSAHRESRTLQVRGAGFHNSDG